jgi:hypothetical protein
MEHRQLRLALLRSLGAADRAVCADPDAEIVSRVEGLVRERPVLLADREALTQTVGERDRAIDLLGQALARCELLEAAAGSAMDGGSDLLDRVRLAVDPDEEEDLRTAEDVVDAVAREVQAGRVIARGAARLRTLLFEVLDAEVDDTELVNRVAGLCLSEEAAQVVVARLRRTIARATDVLAPECPA